VSYKILHISRTITFLPYLLFLTFFTSNVIASTYYISPDGSDKSTGTNIIQPFKSFKHSFSILQGGDELILLDGDYSESNGTGILRGQGLYGQQLVHSAAIPSGKSVKELTRIRALNFGKVRLYNIESLPSGHGKPLHIGTKKRKDKFIYINGIIFEGGGKLYNTQHITIKNSGFHGSFGIGSNDHHFNNDFNLIEDVWIWTNNSRISASNYRAHKNVWRRVLVKSDGCDYPGCESYPKKDPSVGITVYDSQDVSLQNIIVIDRLIRNDIPYGDFASAQHTSDPKYHLGRNEWLGSISINSQDMSMHFEADNIISKNEGHVWRIKDFLSINSPRGGINLGNTPYNYDKSSRPVSTIENATILLPQAKKNISAIRVSPQVTSTKISNSITVGATRTGFNAKGSVVRDSVSYNPKSTEKAFDVKLCEKNCIKIDTNPRNDGSLSFTINPYKRSTIESLGEIKTHIGASITHKTGADGSKFGGKNYNKLTKNLLWPWPNEKIILNEICKKIKQGICNTPNNTNRIFNYILDNLHEPILQK